MHYTYKITNNINGKFYIGKRTYNGHDINKDSYMGSGVHIKRAIKKYGVLNFTKEILGVFETAELAYEHEADLVTIDLIELVDCYNLRTGGGDGSIPSEETRAKLSKARKGKIASEEARAKIGKASASRTHSAETRAKIGKASRTQSAETRAKMSKAATGRTQSAETILKRTGINNHYFKGYHCTPMGKFITLKEAGTANDCCQASILKRTKSTKDKFKDYYFESN